MFIYVDGCASLFRVYWGFFPVCAVQAVENQSDIKLGKHFEQLGLVVVYGLDLNLDTVKQQMLSH